MIITANKNIFVINGKRYTYAMYVNAAGYLQHAYYGKKISASDVEYYVKHVGSRLEPRSDDMNFDMAFDAMPSEYGFFAHGDYREPSVIVERQDGAAMSRLKYRDARITDGAPDIIGMPHARNGGKTLRITLADEFSDTLIALNYTAFDDCDVLVRNVEIKNNGKGSVALKKAFSCCVELPDGDYDILRLCGAWAAERTPVVSRVEQGIIRIQSLRGASSHQTNPFAALIKHGCAEESGECYGVQLIYSGSFAITAEKAHNGSVRIQGGINDTGFAWRLGGCESLVTPQVALCYSDGGLGSLSREYADFLRGHVIPPEYVYKPRPVVINNWEATYFDFDSEKLFALIDEAAKLGIDTFVLDDGWFGKRDGDTSGLGDWRVNEKKLKGGLDPVIERCKARGLKFGLWFEPEAISEDSELYRAHPDWAIGKDGVPPARWRNQLVLDFTRAEVVGYIFDAVSKILREHDISYVKWDFNRNISEFYSRTLDDQGEFAHRYILGVYGLAERLTKAFPDVFFEGCAGGGGRFDAGMLYYFPQIWTSDNTDAYERAKIQWGTSICYPMSAMSCHVSACPNHQTGRTVPLGTRGAVASLGAFGYELDPSKLSDAEKCDIKRQIEDHKRNESLVLNGDTYRLSSPFCGKEFCVMQVSKDKACAFVVYEKLRGDRTERILKLRGLDEKKIYSVSELGIAASGRSLMEIGLPLPSLGDYESLILTVRVALF